MPAVAAREPAHVEDETLLQQLRALADKSRIKMLSALADGRELCVGDLMAVAGVSQPLASHHLRVLRKSGLVQRRREGTWFHYRQDRGAVDALMGNLGEGLGAAPSAVRANDCEPGPRRVK